MSRGIRKVLLGLFRRNEETTEDSGGKEDQDRFVPSPLDQSVRIGHGGSSDERARELADVSEQARELENERRDD